MENPKNDLLGAILLIFAVFSLLLVIGSKEPSYNPRAGSHEQTRYIDPASDTGSVGVAVKDDHL